jgi:hypothetical protein
MRHDFNDLGSCPAGLTFRLLVPSELSFNHEGTAPLSPLCGEVCFMFPIMLRLVASIELALVIVEACFPLSAKFLPLGGSPLAQIGILFGLGLVACEWTECYQWFRPSRTKSNRP